MDPAAGPLVRTVPSALRIFNPNGVQALETELKVATRPTNIPDPVDGAALSTQFTYDEAQWRKMAKIVERAGKDDGVADALEKLEAKRVYLERRFGALPRPDAEAAAAESRRCSYERVEARAAELRAALDDLEWWFFTDSEDTWTNFTSTLDHIHGMAARRARRTYFRKNIGRDVYFDQLGIFWLRKLGLPWKPSPDSRMTKFIEAACRDYDFKGKNARSTISQALCAGDDAAGGPPEQGGVKIPMESK
jgi:hypothetical protein